MCRNMLKLFPLNSTWYLPHMTLAIMLVCLPWIVLLNGIPFFFCCLFYVPMIDQYKIILMSNICPIQHLMRYKKMSNLICLSCLLQRLRLCLEITFQLYLKNWYCFYPYPSACQSVGKSDGSCDLDLMFMVIFWCLWAVGLWHIWCYFMTLHVQNFSYISC